MATIGATNQSPAEAISELIANCFGARYHDEKLNIIVDLRGDEIKVIDDGKGMPVEVLAEAIRIAEDMGLHIERGEDSKGHFGMGFKTSCAALGNFYEIYTRPANEEIEYHVEFDINDYGKKPSGSDAWNVEIEDFVPKSPASPLGDAERGTAFIVKVLKRSDILTGNVIQYLGEAFKAHLKDGDNITVIDNQNSYKVRPKTPKFVDGTKIDIDETFGGPNNDKYHITGWVALDWIVHNDGRYGFSIYRHNQLVGEYDKSWFRAHTTTSRIIGEVNMDFLDATFYKQGVQQSADWEYVKEHMKEFLRGVVRASQGLSRKGNINKPAERLAIVNKLRAEYGLEPLIPGTSSSGGNVGGKNTEGEKPGQEGENGDNSDDSGNNGGKPSNPGGIKNIKTIVELESLKLASGQKIDITCVEKETGGDVKAPFDYVFDEDMDDEDNPDLAQLQVLIYRDHSLWKKRIDNAVRQTLATSDAIYRVLVEKLGMTPSEALKVRNEWLQLRTEKEQ